MRKTFTILTLILLTLTNWAQSPNKLSYQAVVRDADNNLVTEETVGMQISILQSSATGAPVYTETHSPTTKSNGLITIEIGGGATTDVFSAIDWASGPYFIKTEIDPEGGVNYSITGTSQILSVPYAKYADIAGNAFSGDYGDLSGAPTDVSDFSNDAGYLTEVTGTETAFDGWDKDEDPWQINGTNLYYNDGNVGIGIDSPSENLDVVGSTKFGSSGVVFSELREITGTTSETLYYTHIALPSGYNEENTRILSLHINYNNDRWSGLGHDNGEANRSVGYIINGSQLTIYCPDIINYKGVALKVLMMKIE